MAETYTPTVATFEDFFDRGQFTYGDDLPDVRDKDIEEAISEAESVFNSDLYPEDDTTIGTKAELYLTAFFLQNDLDAADSQGQSKYNQSARSGDGVSESLQIPDWMQKGDFALYATNYYGQKYLLISRPYLGGVVFSVHGATQW